MKNWLDIFEVIVSNQTPIDERTARSAVCQSAEHRSTSQAMALASPQQPDRVVEERELQMVPARLIMVKSIPCSTPAGS